MIVPSLTALFPDSAVQVLGNECPLLRSVCYHELEYALIFFASPCAFDVEGLSFAFWFLLAQKETVSFFHKNNSSSLIRRTDRRGLTLSRRFERREQIKI